MRINNKIIQIKEVHYPNITFISRNGDHRIIDLKECFKKLKLNKNDFGYDIINDPDLFNSVTLDNNAFAWKKLSKTLTLPSGKNLKTYFHLDPVTSIQFSQPLKTESDNSIGAKVKITRQSMHLTQDELAAKIGTGKHYISKVENSKTDLEYKTLQKIFEVGLNKRIYLAIYEEPAKLKTFSNSILKPAFLEWINKRKNDLHLIEGINKELIGLFREQKIISPLELSKLEFKSLLELLKKIKKPLPELHYAESWILQAKYILKEEWTNLILLQKTIAGRHSRIEYLAGKELKEGIFEI